MIGLLFVVVLAINDCLLISKKSALDFSLLKQENDRIKDEIGILKQSLQQAMDEVDQKQKLINWMRRQSNTQKTGVLPVNPANGQAVKDSNSPTVYAITPTYSRYTQKADLTRLSQTFLHIPNFHWILVEDSKIMTPLVKRFLQRSGLNYTHLAVPTPAERKLAANEPRWRKARGVEQRNLGIEWLVSNQSTSQGVVYFADDDNTYDLRIFEQMRFTRRVSVWPVGLTGGLRFEGPVCSNGKVTGWHTAWHPERPFPLDMAGFAVNLKELAKNPAARIDPNAARGYLESSLLQHILSRYEAEPLANDCTEVLVWHTRTEAPKMKDEIRLQKLGKPSDPRIET